MEWLLKYPPQWFAAGSLGIAWSWPTYTLLLAGVVALLWLAGYRRVRRGGTVLLLRGLLAAVVLLALAQPVLVVQAPGPVSGHVALLVDDSLSMRIRDRDGRSRAEQADALLARGDGTAPAFLQTLGRRIEIRSFRYGDGVTPFLPGEPLRYAAPRSELGAALAALAEGQGQAAGALAAVVVVSDGGDSPAPDDPQALERALQTLRAVAVPVHVVALGARRAAPDLEVRALRLPRTLLVEDRAEVEVEIAQRGLAGRHATLILEEEGLIADRLALTLPADDAPLTVRRRLRFATPGGRLLSARLAPMEEETNIENNQLERTVEVRSEPLRVLHFEAEPRFETKFVRRAVARDPAIRLTSLVRTADNKYYRLGVEEASELADGFPSDPAELFRYQVLILGSVPAALLSTAQQAAIRDFVARRGGGLLLLGGRQSFAEGGHGSAVVGELAPVVLGEAGEPFHEAVKVRLGAAGRSDPRIDLGAAEEREALFARLPPLTVANPHRQAKPGATVLLEGRDRRGAPLILLAAQRYGLGRVMSFAVRNSWRWQMHASVAVEDQTHETLWRQLLRDLGREAGGRVRLAGVAAAATPGRPVAVRAQALDDRYQPLAQAALQLKVTSPLGEIQRHALTATGQGGYATQFVPQQAGRHELVVELEEAGEVVAGDRAQIDVSTAGAEFHTALDGPQRLERIAAATGGQVVEAADAERLAGLIAEARGQRTELQRLPLWDAPLLLLALVALACGEWVLRRLRRLA